MIAKRLSTNSSSEKEFMEEVGPYNVALKNAGYKETLKYIQKKSNGSKKRNRRRNITWFNPPFSKSVYSNVSRMYARIVQESFPPGSILSKIFNKNTLKLSYSCTPNMKTLIMGHNTRVLKKNRADQGAFGCNCRQRVASCPLRARCKE